MILSESRQTFFVGRRIRIACAKSKTARETPAPFGNR